MTDENNLTDDAWKIVPGRPSEDNPSDTLTVSVPMPASMLNIIDAEARRKYKSRAEVIRYLIWSGIKAHRGTFYPPKNNTI